MALVRQLADSEQAEADARRDAHAHSSGGWASEVRQGGGAVDASGDTPRYWGDTHDAAVAAMVAAEAAARAAVVSPKASGESAPSATAVNFLSCSCTTSPLHLGQLLGPSSLCYTYALKLSYCRDHVPFEGREQW